MPVLAISEVTSPCLKALEINLLTRFLRFSRQPIPGSLEAEQHRSGHGLGSVWKPGSLGCYRVPSPDMDTGLKIISGGQTGADRAALDFALAHGIPHWGSVPV